MSKSKKKARRNFLKDMGVFSGASAMYGPLSIIMDSIVNGAFGEALAQEASINPRALVFLQQAGGPPRWTFDKFIVPYSTAGFQQNPHMGTRYTSENGRYTGVEYATASVKGLNAPWIWQFDVASVGGGVRPMGDLLNHFLNITGVNTGNSSHDASRRLQFKPLAASRSIPALPADHSNLPFPGVGISASEFIFKSAKGWSPVTIGRGGNIIQNLLSPFDNRSSSTYKTRKAALQSTLDNAISLMAQTAIDRNPSSDLVVKTRQNADELLAQGITGLSTEWNNLYSKYKDLVDRSIQGTLGLQGLGDLPIGTTGTRELPYRWGTSNIVNNPDMRDMIQSSTNNNSLAQVFAATEYLLKRQLTKSITANISILNSVNINGNNSSLTHDEHNIGAMVTLLLNSAYNRGYAACLLELIDQLKSANLFGETVIHCASEFDRNPRTDMRGSDHGWQGSGVAMYSGAINTPLVVGNIRANSGSSGYTGSWKSGGVDALGGIEVDLGHVASTVSTLLRTPSPVTARGSLIAESNGNIIPVIERSKLV